MGILSSVVIAMLFFFSILGLGALFDFSAVTSECFSCVFDTRRQHGPLLPEHKWATQACFVCQVTFSELNNCSFLPLLLLNVASCVGHSGQCRSLVLCRGLLCLPITFSGHR